MWGGKCSHIQAHYLAALVTFNRWFIRNELKYHADEPGCVIPFWADFAEPNSKNRGCCDGHPGSSHQHGDAGDKLYFTTHPTSNVTQTYGNTDRFPSVQIWNGQTPTGALACCREARYFLGLSEVFPFVRYHIRDFAYEHIMQEIKDSRKFTHEEIQKYSMLSNMDSSPVYHHWIHTHVTFDVNAPFGENYIDYKKLAQIVRDINGC